MFFFYVWKMLLVFLPLQWNILPKKKLATCQFSSLTFASTLNSGLLWPDLSGVGIFPVPDASCWLWWVVVMQRGLVNPHLSLLIITPPVCSARCTALRYCESETRDSNISAKHTTLIREERLLLCITFHVKHQLAHLIITCFHYYEPFISDGQLTW